MKKLSELELVNCGDWQGYYTYTPDKNNEYKWGKFAFIWMDHDQHYFIANHSSLRPGKPCSRERLRQVDKVTLNAPPEHVEFDIPQPKVAEHYHSANSKIDKLNRVQQDDFQLERKLGTKD